MNIKQARRFIRHSEIIQEDLFDYITNNLIKIYSKYCNYIDYEFSLNSRNLDIGFSYEPLYDFKNQISSFSILKKEIFSFIYNFLNFLNVYYKIQFDLEKIKKIFLLVLKSNSLFIHFGFEISNKCITKVKVYFIPLYNLIPNFRQQLIYKILLEQFRRVSTILKYKWSQLEPFINDELNAFAIDFLTDVKYYLKIYKSYQIQLLNNNKNLNFDKEILNWLLNLNRIKDMDIMYRIPASYVRQSYSHKIYFYPKPALKIDEICRNKKIKILRQLKDLHRKTVLDSIKVKIYSISLEENSTLNIYIR